MPRLTPLAMRCPRRANGVLPPVTAQDSGAAGSDLLIDRNEIKSMPVLVDRPAHCAHQVYRTTRSRTRRRASPRIARADIERTICHGPARCRLGTCPTRGSFSTPSLAPETSALDRSILLHELVHFLQDLNAEGADMEACERWLHREREAYALQNRYLAAAERSRQLPPHDRQPNLGGHAPQHVQNLAQDRRTDCSRSADPGGGA